MAVAVAEMHPEVELVVVVHLEVEVEAEAHSLDASQGRTTSRQMQSTIQAPGIRHSLWSTSASPGSANWG